RMRPSGNRQWTAAVDRVVLSFRLRHGRESHRTARSGHGNGIERETAELTALRQRLTHGGHPSYPVRLAGKRRERARSAIQRRDEGRDTARCDRGPWPEPGISATARRRRALDRDFGQPV